MTDLANQEFGKHYQVGYCTNVHAGRDLPSVLDNLEKHSLPIRKLVGSELPLCVGLWFSEVSAAQALQPAALASLKNKLEQFQLVPFSLNGFPQGDFHSRVVKHRVYQPTWWQQERLDYTLNLIRLLDQLLAYGQVGSISTLPIAWRDPLPTRDQLKQAASQLIEVATVLHRQFEQTGRKIVLAIEPEPGCYLTDSSSFRMFFNEYLRAAYLPDGTSEIVGEYLTLCHDVCHAAVMYEDQTFELQQLKNDDIAIGKVQVSSAVKVDWDAMTGSQRVEAFEQLKGFAEDRYLHQVNRTVNRSVNRSVNQTVNQTVNRTESARESRELIEDLPAAMSSVSNSADLTGEWRIHFHVPIFLSQLGLIQSTQSEILKLLEILSGPADSRPEFTGHFEVETYAWGVLPKALFVESLNEGIAREVTWFNKALSLKGK